MFAVGDYIVRANDGVCKIEGVVQMDMFHKNEVKDYYLLIPLEQNCSKIYVSVERADSQLRKAVNEQEAWSIIDEIPEIEETWIQNDREREMIYRQAIQSCDLKALVGIIKNMYHRRERRVAQGKKNTAVDEKYFKLAENHLYGELAFALGKKKDEMEELITKRVQMEE
ncbi:MAG: CarD family transcriptional regulator [Lachnospiraceae bacterium]